MHVFRTGAGFVDAAGAAFGYPVVPGIQLVAPEAFRRQRMMMVCHLSYSGVGSSSLLSSFTRGSFQGLPVCSSEIYPTQAARGSKLTRYPRVARDV